MIPPQSRQLLELYVARLREWGRQINLVGPAVLANPWPLVEEAIVPARLGLEAARHLLDVGSGSGVPAIPLAIAWGSTRLTLVEPRGRRAAFLKVVAAELGLDVTVHACRWQDLPPIDAPDALSGRGLGELSSWIDGLAPRLADQARVLVASGPTARKELCDRPGLSLELEHVLSDSGRTLFVLRKGDVPRGTLSRNVAG